jgi:hypothetical protein
VVAAAADAPDYASPHKSSDVDMELRELKNWPGARWIKSEINNQFHLPIDRWLYGIMPSEILPAFQTISRFDLFVYPFC